MEETDRHRDARRLLQARKAGVLSTLSLDVAGYPFGSVVPYCLDRQGRPVLLISEIAQHTRNIAADPRVCLTILAGGEDVQASARLSVLARAERLEDGLEDAAERYDRHFPASAGYHQAHDFFFARLEPVRLRWIGGFGDIRWIEPPDILWPNPFSRAQESAIVAAHERRPRRHDARLLPPARGPGRGRRRRRGDGRDRRRRLRPARRRAGWCASSFPSPWRQPDEARRQLVALAR